MSAPDGKFTPRTIEVGGILTAGKGAKGMIRTAIRIVLALTLLLACSLALQAKVNFQGDWKMNASKSEFGQFPAPSAMTMKITHADPSMKVANKMATDNGDFEFESVYDTEGKETTNKFGPGEMKSTAKWDGDVLVVESKGDMGGGEFKMADKYSLAGDGKTLTIQRHFSSGMGEMDQKIVLEKQ
jgi:hypothetical protein